MAIGKQVVNCIDRVLPYIDGILVSCSFKACLGRIDMILPEPVSEQQVKVKKIKH